MKTSRRIQTSLATLALISRVKDPTLQQAGAGAEVTYGHPTQISKFSVKIRPRQSCLEARRAGQLGNHPLVNKRLKRDDFLAKPLAGPLPLHSCV